VVGNGVFVSSDSSSVSLSSCRFFLWFFFFFFFSCDDIAKLFMIVAVTGVCRGWKHSVGKKVVVWL